MKHSFFCVRKQLLHCPYIRLSCGVSKEGFSLEEGRRRCYGGVQETGRALFLPAPCGFASHCAIDCLNHCSASDKLYRQMLGTWQDFRFFVVVFCLFFNGT